VRLTSKELGEMVKQSMERNRLQDAMLAELILTLRDLVESHLPLTQTAYPE